MGTLFRGATVILPTESGIFDSGVTDVLVEGGLIAAVEHGLSGDGHGEVDLAGKFLAPAYMDIHRHGGLGADVMDGTVGALRKISEQCARHGVAAWCPTTMTEAPEAILRSIAACREFMDSFAADCAEPLGVHLEGPYIDKRKKGAQPEQHVKTGVELDCRPFFDRCPGTVRMITLAPEIADNRVVIEEAVRRGIVVIAGHTSASYDEMVEAQKAGISQGTHTWNQMELIHHRKPATVGAVLRLKGIWMQLIVDFVHIHPAVCDISIRAKGMAETVLITDAISGAGMPDGMYKLGGQDIEVKEGAVRLADGTLAGSSLEMDTAVRNALECTGLPLAQCIQMASWNPARSIGVGDRMGAIAPGMLANLNILDADLNIVQTYIHGRLFQSEAA